jgi:hypothetical protein
MPGIDPMLLPAAHTLVQAREDIAPGADHLVAEAQAGIDRAISQLGNTPPATYDEIRRVGRVALPATVLGLIIARGLRAPPAA